MLVINSNEPVATTAWFKGVVAPYPLHHKYGIDFSRAVECPIVTCVVTYGGEVLLAQRRQDVAEYGGMWAIIGGFMTIPSPREAILCELKEEAGIDRSHIRQLIIAPRRTRKDPELAERRVWHEFRGCAILKDHITPQLNAENTAIEWLPWEEALQLPLLPASARVLRAWQRRLSL